jgi:hypothetical protein
MAFIYTETKSDEEENSPTLPKGNLEVTGEDKPNESAFRNSVLKSREKIKLQNGLQSLGDVSREVGLTDANVFGMFQLEKVAK